jgi:hypothetical protein
MNERVLISRHVVGFGPCTQIEALGLNLGHCYYSHTCRARATRILGHEVVCLQKVADSSGETGPLAGQAARNLHRQPELGGPVDVQSISAIDPRHPTDARGQVAGCFTRAAELCGPTLVWDSDGQVVTKTPHSSTGSALSPTSKDSPQLV